ncbi:MAG: methyltransferase family protein [Elusimicrobiota bacterium]
MVLTPETVVNYAWAAWFASWLAAAFWSDQAAKRPGFGAEALYRGVELVGFALLFGAGERFGGSYVLWVVNDAAGWALAGVSALGFLFCWWARIHLGRLWSARVTKKADHRVVDTGPYGFVRHPIYTGLLAAAFSTAVLKGTTGALAGAAVATAGFWIKARLEERFLSAELGAEVYAAYRARVPMLIPFL